MKKTKYFIGTNHRTDQLHVAIKTATDQRDNFLKQNKNTITKVDSEDLIITTWNNNSNVIPTIKLTYYLK